MWNKNEKTEIKGRNSNKYKPCSIASWTLPSQILTRPRCRERLEETTSDGGTWSEGEKEKSELDEEEKKRKGMVKCLLSVVMKKGTQAAVRHSDKDMQYQS